MDKELPRFETVTASSPVLYTATTPTTGFSAVHNTFAVYIDINIYQISSNVVGNSIDCYKRHRLFTKNRNWRHRERELALELIVLFFLLDDNGCFKT